MCTKVRSAMHQNILHSSTTYDVILNVCLYFQDMFPDVELIRSVQNELDDVIQDGIINIVQLLRSVMIPDANC